MKKNEFEIKTNKDGSTNLNSLRRFESHQKIMQELSKFENAEYCLISEKTVSGYLPRKKIIVSEYENGLIQVDIPSFKGTLFHAQRLYKKT